MKEIYISICFTIQPGVAFLRQIPYFFENTISSAINQRNQNFHAIVYIPAKWKPHAVPYMENPQYQRPNIQYSFIDSYKRKEFDIGPDKQNSQLVFLYMVAGRRYPEDMVDMVVMTPNIYPILAYESNLVYEVKRNVVSKQPELNKTFLGYCCSYEEYIRLFRVYNMLYEIWQHIDGTKVPSTAVGIVPIHSR